MSTNVTGHYKEPAEAFDWHHQDILERPPYSHYEMIVALLNGDFIIEGKVSNITDARMYADRYEDEADVWAALEDHEHEELALNGPAF